MVWGTSPQISHQPCLSIWVFCSHIFQAYNKQHIEKKKPLFPLAGKGKSDLYEGRNCHCPCHTNLWSRSNSSCFLCYFVFWVHLLPIRGWINFEALHMVITERWPLSETKALWISPHFFRSKLWDKLLWLQHNNRACCPIDNVTMLLFLWSTGLSKSYENNVVTCKAFLNHFLHEHTSKLLWTLPYEMSNLMLCESPVPWKTQDGK